MILCFFAKQCIADARAQCQGTLEMRLDPRKFRVAWIRVILGPTMFYYLLQDIILNTENPPTCRKIRCKDQTQDRYWLILRFTDGEVLKNLFSDTLFEDRPWMTADGYNQDPAKGLVTGEVLRVCKKANFTIKVRCRSPRSLLPLLINFTCSITRGHNSAKYSSSTKFTSGYCKRTEL